MAQDVPMLRMLQGDVGSAALKAHALIDDGKGGQVWAYEIDGFGNYIFMDDANVPSLSGLPLIDVDDKNDPLFLRTASLAWSDRHPSFFKGTAAAGIVQIVRASVSEKRC